MMLLYAVRGERCREEVMASRKVASREVLTPLVEVAGSRCRGHAVDTETQSSPTSMPEQVLMRTSYIV